MLDIAPHLIDVNCGMCLGTGEIPVWDSDLVPLHLAQPNMTEGEVMVMFWPHPVRRELDGLRIFYTWNARDIWECECVRREQTRLGAAYSLIMV